MAWLDSGQAGRIVSDDWFRDRENYVRHLVAAVGLHRVEDLGELTVPDIQRYCLGIGLANETINKISHNVFSRLLTVSESRKLIPAGTRAAVYANSDRLKKKKGSPLRALTPKQRDRFLAAFVGDDAWCAPHAHTLFYMGLRPGELCGLRQDDFDWTGRGLTIRHSRGNGDDEEDVSDGKNEGAQRELEIPLNLMAILQPLRCEFFSKSDPWFFRSKRGAPLDYHNFQNRDFSRIAKRAGFPKITPHCGRHTVATVMLDQGAEPKYVADYLGIDTATVLKHYVHRRKGKGIDRYTAAPGLKSVTAPDGCEAPLPLAADRAPG